MGPFVFFFKKQKIKQTARPKGKRHNYSGDFRNIKAEIFYLKIMD
jgi:hypothetical protein